MTRPTLSSDAAGHVRSLQTHYEAKSRPQAIRNLILSIEGAKTRIEQAPLAGLAAPRPYPAVARDGERWIKEGNYWFGYTVQAPCVIIAVFYETADIPARR